MFLPWCNTQKVTCVSVSPSYHSTVIYNDICMDYITYFVPIARPIDTKKYIYIICHRWKHLKMSVRCTWEVLIQNAIIICLGVKASQYCSQPLHISFRHDRGLSPMIEFSAQNIEKFSKFFCLLRMSQYFALIISS